MLASISLILFIRAIKYVIHLAQLESLKTETIISSFSEETNVEQPLVQNSLLRTAKNSFSDKRLILFFILCTVLGIQIFF